jgi:hypothetical protein
MTWKTVRLELASTEEYPRGSAGRAFVLHVPVTSDGRIDRVAVNQNPGRATVRRFWGAEADSFGLVEPVDENWALNCDKGGDAKTTFVIEAVPLLLHRRVMMKQPEGSPLPFRVAACA